MHYLDIKFGNGVGHMITDEKAKHVILSKLDSIIKTDTKTQYNNKKESKKFDINSKHIYARYVWNTPTVYLMLYMYNGNLLTLFVYNGYIIYSPIKFEKELYSATNFTIFVGAFNKGFYIITDIIEPREKYITINSKFKRINYILRELYHPIINLDTHKLIFIDYVDQHYIYSLCSDYYSKCEYIKDILVENIMIIDYSNDVITMTAKIDTINKIFTTFLSKYLMHNSCIINKINNVVPRIITLRMYKSEKPDIYHLYDLKKEQYYGIADIPTLEISAYVISIFPPKYVYIITDFIFNDKYSRWRPVPKYS